MSRGVAPFARYKKSPVGLSKFTAYQLKNFCRLTAQAASPASLHRALSNSSRSLAFLRTSAKLGSAVTFLFNSLQIATCVRTSSSAMRDWRWRVERVFIVICSVCLAKIRKFFSYATIKQKKITHPTMREASSR